MLITMMISDDTWEHANPDVGDRLCMARSCEQLLGEVVLPEKYHDDGDDNDIGITMNITTTIMIMIIKMPFFEAGWRREYTPLHHRSNPCI